jgi:predicted nucleic acid-binding protein
MYLLDTNTIIYYLRGALPDISMEHLSRILDERPLISFITKIELLGYNFSSIEEQELTETFING